MAAKRNLFRFGCHAGQQGLQPLQRDQCRIDKPATGTNFSNKHQHDPQDIKLSTLMQLIYHLMLQKNKEKTFIHFVTF